LVFDHVSFAIPPVVPLFHHGCPSAVGRLIVAVDIYPINGKAICIAVSHCPVIEGLKVIQPLIADLDASTTVILVFLVIGVVASLLHAIPNPMQPCVVFPMDGIPDN
jgi:hypothetical protein